MPQNAPLPPPQGGSGSQQLGLKPHAFGGAGLRQVAAGAGGRGRPTAGAPGRQPPPLPPNRGATPATPQGVHNRQSGGMQHELLKTTSKGEGTKKPQVLPNLKCQISQTKKGRLHPPLRCLGEQRGGPGVHAGVGGVEPQAVHVAKEEPVAGLRLQQDWRQAGALPAPRHKDSGVGVTPKKNKTRASFWGSIVGNLQMGGSCFWMIA